MERAKKQTGNHTNVVIPAEVAHFHKMKKPEPREVDFILTGKHKNNLIHVTAYLLLKNGKFSFGCDLCEKREVFDFATIESWSKQKVAVVAKVVPMVQVNFVSVQLCGHKISILRADLKRLVDSTKKTLPEESSNNKKLS